MNHDIQRSTAPAAGPETPQAWVDVQRQELQRRIETLRDAGALPTPPTSGAASVAQWSNWSNG